MHEALLGLAPALHKLRVLVGLHPQHLDQEFKDIFVYKVSSRTGHDKGDSVSKRIEKRKGYPCLTQ